MSSRRSRLPADSEQRGRADLRRRRRLDRLRGEMTAGTATGGRESAWADLRARATRWPRSPVFYGIVVAVVAAVAGQWVIHPPAAYGLCSACHGRDLENGIINHVYGKQLFVTTAGSHWPLFTVVGVVLGSTLA